MVDQQRSLTQVGISATTTRTATPETRAPSLATTRVLVWLSSLIALLALVAAGAGLFWQGGTGPATFTSIHGETVELYAKGLYRYDSIFKAGANQGADLVTIIIAIPLLVITARMYQRGSMRGHLLLTGTLVWFLYAYASQALATTYNEFFLVYVVLFSASLFAFVLAFSSIDLPMLATRFSARLPRRSVGIFMIVSGLVPFVVWLAPLLSAMLRGESPELLDHSTTMVTEVLDLGIIVPAALISGLLILRRAPLGYLLAFSLLILEVMLAPMIAAQTAFQIAAGVSFTTAMIVGPIAGFTTIAVIGVWIIASLLRQISDESPSPFPSSSG
jgi:hypothetical protein